MNRDDLRKINIDLYKSIDIINDSRINVFTKAGSNAILFSLIVIGYFVSNEQLLFPFRTIPIYVLQFALTFIAIMVYSFFHDLLHFLASKIVKINLKLKFKFIFPYVEFTSDIAKKSNYVFMLLFPFSVFLLILIPCQIIVGIYAHDWFWLVYVIIIQNFVVSIDDFAYIIYSGKYKNSYLQISEKSINIYFNIKSFSENRKKERIALQTKIQKKQMHNERIKQLKNAPKLGKDLYKQKQDSLNKELENDKELDDLSKLDS